jgi:hypothetical protein
MVLAVGGNHVTRISLMGCVLPLETGRTGQNSAWLCIEASIQVMKLSMSNPSGKKVIQVNRRDLAQHQ